MIDCNVAYTPAASSSPIVYEAAVPLAPKLYKLYTSLGALLYLCICTRPDISHAVMQLTRRMASPSQLDWIAAKRVLRYLKGHRFPLTYSNTGTDSLPLHGYADANFAGNISTRKSTGGNVFMFQKGAISAC